MYIKYVDCICFIVYYIYIDSINLNDQYMNYP